MARPTLVLYASTHGHTAKVAARAADGLRDAGPDVRLRAIVDVVERRRDALAERPAEVT